MITLISESEYVWRMMLVLNGSVQARENTFPTTTTTTTIDDIRTSRNCMKRRKKLSVSNVKFLQSLGFAVRNI